MASTSLKLTFAMVDLAGFTALTETHGDEHGADLAVGFTDIARSQLSTGDRLVKTIGDAVLLASPSPTAGLELVGRILAECYRQDSYPVARVGLHHGPAVQRQDDFFGTSVNLAARVASLAAGGQVLATSEVARTATQRGVVTRPLGGHDIKNITGQLDLWEVILHPKPKDSSVDPVCRMLVDNTTAAGQVTHGDRVYWFCSLECARSFASNPSQYS